MKFNKNKFMRNEIGTAFIITLMSLMLLIPDGNLIAMMMSILVGLGYIWIRENNFDKNYKNPLNIVHQSLALRYMRMFEKEKHTPGTKFCIDTSLNQGSPESRPESLKVYSMLYTLSENIDRWPVDKSSRWMGYIQRYLIEQNITTVNEERDFSRPLFQKAYRLLGYEVPETVEIK